MGTPARTTARKARISAGRRQRHSLARITAETQATYEAHLDEYLRQWGGRRYRLPSLLGTLLRLRAPNGLILDLGCGPGQDLRYLKGKEFRAIGVDLAWPFLRYARRRSTRLRLVRADARCLPLRRDTITTVWAAASLIHLPKPALREVLEHLGELVRQPGMLAATFLHGRSSGYLRTGWIPGRYVSKWQKAELARVVRRAGWQIISLETVTNRERKGRWLNLLAQRSGKTSVESKEPTLNKAR